MATNFLVRLFESFFITSNSLFRLRYIKPMERSISQDPSAEYKDLHQSFEFRVEYRKLKH